MIQASLKQQNASSGSKFGELRELTKNGVKVDLVEGSEEKANLVGGKVGHGGQGMKERERERGIMKIIKSMVVEVAL